MYRIVLEILNQIMIRIIFVWGSQDKGFPTSLVLTPLGQLQSAIRTLPDTYPTSRQCSTYFSFANFLPDPYICKIYTAEEVFMVTKLVQEMFTFSTKSVGLLLSHSFSSSKPKLCFVRSLDFLTELIFNSILISKFCAAY